MKTLQTAELIRTSTACPEQYDLRDAAGNQLGYFRLRHCHFTAHAVQDNVLTIVYGATTKGVGRFADGQERRYQLGVAVTKVLDASGERFLDETLADEVDAILDAAGI